MPSSQLSNAIKEAYASCPDDVVIIHTLEFRHPGFTNEYGQPDSIRVVKDYRDWEAKLEADAPLNPGTFQLFVGFSFDMSLPGVENLASPSVQVSIDNVSQDIVLQIEQASSLPDLIEMTYRPYLSTDVDSQGRLNAPHMDPVLTLVITNITVDNFTITATASFGDFANKRFPSEEYTPARFPGLVR